MVAHEFPLIRTNRLERLWHNHQQRLTTSRRQPTQGDPRLNTGRQTMVSNHVHNPGATNWQEKSLQTSGGWGFTLPQLTRRSGRDAGYLSNEGLPGDAGYLGISEKPYKPVE
jgi:hypothetical protein